uniref:Cullin-associated NEDD8-dissociated protein 1 n=1 Tax=Aceria tosichella TaxID=561515 RepID=A0A6G1SA80_9ACAR
MAQPTSIQSLLDRMTSADKDFRFMATNDLIIEMQQDNIRMDDDSETKVTKQIIGLLGDKNGEVQNLAVKCLGFLVAKIKDARRQYVIKQLCTMLKNDSEQIRDIASIALKTIVTIVPFNKEMISIVDNDLIQNLLQAVCNHKDVNVQLESLDILTELIVRVGSQLIEWHDSIQQNLFTLLQSERSAVRKRSMNALANLLACCSDDLFCTTMTRLIQALSSLSPKSIEEAENTFSSNSTQCVAAKTILQCIATIVRQAGHRSNEEHLKQVMPVIHGFCKVNDDEVREYCIQTFEAYIKRCPVIVNVCLADIIDVCLKNVAYDPNYNYDEDDDDDEAMDMDGDDEGSDSADDYSDDDDLSWKVRRSSAKCLEALVVSRPDLINDLFVTIGPVLVSRFKEREDSVKADIIQAFVALLKQTRQLARDAQDSQNAPVALVKLNEMVPVIVAKSANLLREKSTKTRQFIFQMFIEIMNALPKILAPHIDSLIPGILYSMVDKNSTSTMKIDVLVFIQELLKTHEPPTFYPQVHVLLPAVITAINDSFYKIASEALALLSQLVCVIRPSGYEPMPDFESVLSTIYTKTVERMSKADLDIEIKERAISCMGQIVATFGDKMADQLPVALEMIHDKLGNDATRLTAVKALIKIANSPINMSLDSLFPRAFTTVAPFLRKNSRPLKVSTLILIDNVVRRSADLLDSKTAQSILLTDVQSLINENDLYVSQLALTMLTTVVKTHKAFNEIVPQFVLPETLKLIRSPLLQGSALQASLQFLSTIVQSSFPGLDHNAILVKLVEPIYGGMQVHKQAYYSTAKAIAAVSIGDQSRALMTVSQLVEDCKQNLDNDCKYTLALLSIGEIGKVTDLSQVPNLVEVILKAFNSSSEDVKSAGSFALGCIAVGNMNVFLPIILHEIESRNKRQYLILHSLREVITAGHLEQLESIWSLLMKHCECQEEGTRNVVSECLGKLTTHKPVELLQRLLHSLKNDYKDKPYARSTIVAAIKFTISDQPHEIDNVLRQCIGEFLLTLQDSDINVRRVALITFNSAAHHKPSLIVDLLPKFLPLLYQETLVKPELIREVEMGPFKHKVDDGLDSRKAAFECMYTLLDTCQNQLDILEFLTHVENGLKDHYDIKMLTYLMVNRLAALCPSAVLQRMDRLIYPIEEVCRSKPKENAVKQEHEKQDELKRSALRAFDALKAIPGADRHHVLVKFYENLIMSDKELKELYSSIQRDTVNSNSDTIHRMDQGRN